MMAADAESFLDLPRGKTLPSTCNQGSNQKFIRVLDRPRSTIAEPHLFHVLDLSAK